MPKMIINSPKYVPAREIPMGHIARNNAGEVVFRTKHHMTFLFSNGEEPYVWNIEDCTSTYEDLGPLQID